MEKERSNRESALATNTSNNKVRMRLQLQDILPDWSDKDFHFNWLATKYAVI
jgi:hypothetical protein